MTHAEILRFLIRYGHFRVPSQKFIWGSTSLIGSHDHICHKPPGGEFPIPTHREKRPVQSKIGSLQNIHHLPVVTDKKVFLSVTTRQQSYRKVMFSVVCISLSVYRRRVLCDHYPWCVGPQSTGTPFPSHISSPVPYRHVQPCLAWTTLCIGPHLPL